MTKPNNISGIIIKNQVVIQTGKTTFNGKGKKWNPKFLLRCLACDSAIEIFIDKLDLRTIKKCKCERDNICL